MLYADIFQKNHLNSLILGQYNSANELVYKGHVTLGTNLKVTFNKKPVIINQSPFRLVPNDHENAIWFKPEIVGIVQYMPNDKNSLRKPVFKGIRDDKFHTECKTRNP